jgi:hypothetical protein
LLVASRNVDEHVMIVVLTASRGELFQHPLAGLKIDRSSVVGPQELVDVDQPNVLGHGSASGWLRNDALPIFIVLRAQNQ